MCGTVLSDNRREVLNQLKQLCADGSQLTVSDVNLAMDTVDRSLALPDSMDDLAALDSTVTVLSNLIGADTEVLQEANRMSRAASRSATKTPNDCTVATLVVTV